MPFPAEERINVPNDDLLSWMFEVQKYDQNAPVGLTHPYKYDEAMQLTCQDLC
jgi:hypothetical protein